MQRYIKWLARPIAFRVFILVMCLAGTVVMLVLANVNESAYKRESDGYRYADYFGQTLEQLGNVNRALKKFIRRSESSMSITSHYCNVSEITEGYERFCDMVRAQSDAEWCMRQLEKNVDTYRIYAGVFGTTGLIVFVLLLVWLRNCSAQVQDKMSVRQTMPTIITWILSVLSFAVAVRLIVSADYEEDVSHYAGNKGNVLQPAYIKRINEDRTLCQRFRQSASSDYVNDAKKILEKIKETQRWCEGIKTRSLEMSADCKKDACFYRMCIYPVAMLGLLFGWSFIGCLFGKGLWWPIKVAMGGPRFVRRHWIIFCVILGIVWITGLILYAVNKISDTCRGRESVTSAELNNINNMEQINSQQSAMTEQINQLNQLEQQRQQQQLQMMIIQNAQNMMNQTLNIAPTPTPGSVPRAGRSQGYCPVHQCTFTRGIGMGGGCPMCNTAKYGGRNYYTCPKCHKTCESPFGHPFCR